MRHVLGFFREICCFIHWLQALLVGGVISEDRSNGTSALYFSRPINRFDYVGMKYLAVATIQSVIIIGTLFLYYLVDILAMGRGWAWILDTFPLFLTTLFCAFLLIATYTSIGLALSSVSRGNFSLESPFLRSYWEQKHSQRLLRDCSIAPSFISSLHTILLPMLDKPC